MAAVRLAEGERGRAARTVDKARFMNPLRPPTPVTGSCSPSQFYQPPGTGNPGWGEVTSGAGAKMGGWNRANVSLSDSSEGKQPT